MIVECVGLPGAGKTTICSLLRSPHCKKGCVRVQAIRLNSALVRACWCILLLCIATRPITLNRMKRGVNLVLFLRHYQSHKGNTVLDQGQIQKLWSILADANHYSSRRLHEVMASLKPFAPEWVVWVETPTDLAVNRLSARIHGNSRYDGLLSESIRYRLSIGTILLRNLTEQFCQTTHASLLEVDGTLEPVENAARIDALLGSHE